MRFEWDVKKARRNIRKHRVSFTEAATVFNDPQFIVAADDDYSDSERRFVIMGESNIGRVLVVAYVEREARIRLISAREATRRERQNYEEEI